MLQRLRDSQLGQASLHRPPPGWSTTLVKRLRLERVLEGHDGCVNTVHFSPDGHLLVSGSDDVQIILWDWQAGSKALAYHSGHHNNVFQARIMPHSANGTVVTCAADGLVRVGHIPQGAGGAAVETRRLACHRGRAHKLALEPDSAHCFLSCGEDGEVRHFDLREPRAGNRVLLACRDHQRRLELNSVHCHPGSTQFCVAGGDPFVRVYDLRRAPPSTQPIAEPVSRLAPWHLRGRRGMVTITCAVFAQDGRVLATYNDENIYLFASEQQQQQQGMAGPAGEGTARGGAPRSGPAAAAAPAQQQSGQRDAGVNGADRTGAAGAGKRGRGSGEAGPSSSGGAESSGSEERAAADRARGQQRRAAAAAALAQAQGRLAASGAAAAAEAHAGMRRMLDDESAEAGPSSASGAAAPAPAGPAGAGSGADAAWIDMLPAPGAGANGAAGRGKRRLSAGQAGQEEAAEQSSGSAGQDEQEGQEEEEEDSRSDIGAEEEQSEDASESSDSMSEDEDAEEGEEGSDDDDDSSGFVAGSNDFEGDAEANAEGALIDDSDTIQPAGGRAGSGAAPASHAADEREGQREGQPSDHVLQSYVGHRNYRTVKGVSFLGAHDEFVISGSDCGHILVWDAASGEVQAMLKGDSDTVNCLEPHPHHLLTLATSGIEDTIKLWAPTAEEPQVIGAAEERRMAANQRDQGEERRLFVSPQMLRLLLRARQMGAPRQDSDEEGEEGESEDGSSDDDGEGRGRHHGDCTIS